MPAGPLILTFPPAAKNAAKEKETNRDLQALCRIERAG
jgi:predicted small lipoprotein YifL